MERPVLELGVVEHETVDPLPRRCVLRSRAKRVLNGLTVRTFVFTPNSSSMPLTWQCASMKPGVTVWPPASITWVRADARTAHVGTGAHRDEPAVLHGEGLGPRSGGRHREHPGVNHDEIGLDPEVEVEYASAIVRRECEGAQRRCRQDRITRQRTASLTAHPASAR
jgi:hypothetical protein